MIPASQLAGTAVEGAIQVTESAANALIAASAPTAPALTFDSGNRVLVRYRMFQAEMMLPAALDPAPTPRLTLTLASLLVAWGLKAFVQQPYLRVHGRSLTIDLAEVPALAPWRHLLPALKHVGFTSGRGSVRVHFSLDIRS